MKSIHLEMLRVTEAAAIACSPLIGKGDKIALDQVATDAMRNRLNNIPFVAQCVISEGEKDAAPHLNNNEWVGMYRDEFIKSASSEGETKEYLSSKRKSYAIACDALDGTRSSSEGKGHAVSVLAIAEEGGFFTTPAYYMNKLVVGKEIAKRMHVDINDPISRTIKTISLALNREPSKITACVLDRPRHAQLIKELRETGCKVIQILDGDVMAATAVCLPDSGVNFMVGTGGSAEGVIASAAVKALGGEMQCQICDNSGNVADKKVLHTNDLCRSHAVFCATGVTNGDILKGVRVSGSGAFITNSLLMRSESGTVRFVETWHGN